MADLVQTEEGLALVSGDMVMRADFTRMIARCKPSAVHRELVVKAAKVKRPHAPGAPFAIDATAGLGEDALLLAAAGFTVHLYERNPTIAALLRDALARAANVPELAGAIKRMRLTEADSAEALRAGSWGGQVPDVVLLDPMFPARQKSAAVKKKLQLLQQLEEPCADEADLLAAALAVRPQKVVVKRPTKGAHLAERTPSNSLSGKAIRFDVYLPN